MKKKIEQIKAEQATGCSESIAPKRIYANGGAELSEAEARALILKGESIEIPNAGAGTYRKVFIDILGYDEIQVVDWGSSAGDWTFGVRKGKEWMMATQDNRWPYYGYSYQVNHRDTHPSFQSLVK